MKTHKYTGPYYDFVGERDEGRPQSTQPCHVKAAGFCGWGVTWTALMCIANMHTDSLNVGASHRQSSGTSSS